MEVFRRPAQGGPRAGRRVVDHPGAARSPAGGVRDCDGRAGGRGAAPRFPGRSAGPRGRHLRAASGAQPDSPGAERQPRRPHRLLALRPAYRGLRAPAGYGAPGRSGADRRPHRGARFRPRHDRAAACHLDGFHRQRHGGDDRRFRVRRDPRPLRVVGAGAAGGRVAGHPLAAARERGLARPQHGGSARRAARCRLRLPPGGGPSRQQGTAALRPRRLDHRAFHRAPHPPARAAVRGHPPARAAGHLEPPDCGRDECAGVLGAGERGRRRSHQSRGGRGLCAERRRRVDDRVRRIHLGARRIGCPRRRRAAPRGGDAPRRRAPLR